MKKWIPLVLLICMMKASGFADQKKPLKPSANDKCAVCGMFVAKYPDFLARITFRDGSYAFFDGAKDMLKYYFNLAKYNTKKKAGDIISVDVTDYYDLTPIDGFNAYYVTGSDVYGPMGRELIPFKDRSDADEFMRDHRGREILKFNEINLETIRGLD